MGGDEPGHVAADRPARQLVAVDVDRVDEAVGVGEDELVAVVAVEVGEGGRRSAVGGRGRGRPADLAALADRLREAVEQVLVVVQPGGALVLPGPRRAGGRRDHDLEGERLRGEERAAVAGRGRGGGDRPGEVGAGREARSQLGDVDRAEDALVGAGGRGAAVRRAVAVAGVDRLEVARVGVGGQGVVRVLAGRDEEPAAVGIAAREDLALDVHRRFAGVDLGEPLRRGDVGLGGQLRRIGVGRVVDDRPHGVIHVRPPVAVELVEALAGRIARRRHRRVDHRSVGVDLGAQRVAGAVGARAAGQRRRRARGLVGGAGGRAGEVDVVGLGDAVERARGEDLLDLVRGDRAGIAADQLAARVIGIGIERPGVLGVQCGAVDQAGKAGGQPDRVRRTGGAGDRDRDLGPEVGAAVERQIGLVGRRPRPRRGPSWRRSRAAGSTASCCAGRPRRRPRPSR